MRAFCDYVLIPFLMILVACLGIALHDKGREIARLEAKMDAHQFRGEAMQQFLADASIFQKGAEPKAEAQAQRDVLKVTVTAYTPTVDQTDEDPMIAASMRKVRPGTVAVSRDLFDQGWVFGKKIRIEGMGIYEINDLMNPRYSRRVDVFMWDEKKAQAFGKRQTRVALLSI